MSIIQNFPQSLIDDHMNWHTHPGDPAQGGRAIPAGQPGSGLEFLTYHMALVAHFHAWYDVQPDDQGVVAPFWTSVPQELQDPNLGWTQEYADTQNTILNNPLTYATADAFGIVVENGIHNWVHEAAAQYYNQPDVSSPMKAVDNTIFYQIHGMINDWWRQWQLAHVRQNSSEAPSFVTRHRQQNGTMVGMQQISQSEEMVISSVTTTS